MEQSHFRLLRSGMRLIIVHRSMSHEDEGGRWKAYKKLGKGNGLERQGKGVGGGVATPLDEGERRYSCRVELCSMASTYKYREGKKTLIALNREPNRS